MANVTVSFSDKTRIEGGPSALYVPSSLGAMFEAPFDYFQRDPSWIVKERVCYRLRQLLET